jgi:hypothetical protein
MVEMGSGSGTPLPMGALWMVPEGRAPLLGTLENKEKRLWDGHVSIGAPLGNLERCLSTRVWEMDVGGCRNGASLSEEAQCGGPVGRAALLGTTKDTLALFFLQSIKSESLVVHMGTQTG